MDKNACSKYFLTEDGHLCRVADNTVWSHWQVASRSSEVNFTKNYTLLYLFFKDTDRKISARSLTLVMFAAVLSGLCLWSTVHNPDISQWCRCCHFLSFLISQNSTLCQETPYKAICFILYIRWIALILIIGILTVNYIAVTALLLMSSLGCC